MTFEQAIEKLKNTSPLRITVSGDIGAGKSTFSKRLAELIGAERVYIGGLMREEAAKRDMTLDAFNELLEQDETVDREMDALQKQKSKEIARGVFEGRTSWYFVENPDVKLYLKADPLVAAQRIWEDDNAMRDAYDSLESLVQANETRKESEMKRYEAYYDIDVYDPSHYDVVLDTSKIDIDAVFERGVTAIASALDEN